MGEEDESIDVKVSDPHFPRQSGDVGKEIEATTPYHVGMQKGKIVRSDLQKPYFTLIQLEDGKYVSSEECLTIKK